MADEPQEAPEMDAPDPEPAPGGDDVESLRKALAKANSEAAKYRLKAKDLEPLAAKAKELEDASKSELQKLQEQLDAVRAESSAAATEAQRLRAALAKAPAGMAAAELEDAARRLVGTTREELEADAEKLFALIAPASTPPAPLGQRTPVEQLRPGAMPTGAAPSLQDQIAAAEAAGNHGLAGQLKTQWLAEIRANTT